MSRVPRIPRICLLIYRLYAFLTHFLSVLKHLLLGSEMIKMTVKAMLDNYKLN